MKVSIIITNFNYEKYLDRCIVSCLNQKFLKKYFEIILIDDCSSDNSFKTAEKYLIFKNFSLIKNKKNIGVSASSNKAIKKAKGKFFVRVDSDDFVDKYFIEELYKNIIKNNKILGVSCNYTYISNEEKKLKRINYKNKPISCGVLYNRKKLLKIGLYNKDFKHREEEELRKRLGIYYKIKNIKKYLYFYRMHNHNKTKKKKIMSNFKKKLSKLYN